MTLTKENFVNSIQNQVGFSKRKSIDTFEYFFDIIKDKLENEEDILISGFGNCGILKTK
jgi:integration host factor subunit alpha